MLHHATKPARVLYQVVVSVGPALLQGVGAEDPRSVFLNEHAGQGPTEA